VEVLVVKRRQRISTEHVNFAAFILLCAWPENFRPLKLMTWPMTLGPLPVFS
jgi:hypothetical protein